MSDLTTADTLRERTDTNRVWFWLLLDANRWAVAGGLAFVVFAAFVAVGAAKPIPIRSTMASGDMIETMFAGLVSAIITGTTLVVSINQLVLSQEIGSLGQMRNRMDVTMDFRQNTDELLGGTTPIDPAMYLDAMVETTDRRAAEFREALTETENPDLYATVDTYVEDLRENAEHTRTRLEDSDFGTFDVVSPALDYNYNRKMHDLRRIERDADLGDAERDALRSLLESLTMYGPVREYVKDLYIQWALVKLSRAILYAAVVALVVAGAVVAFLDPTTFPGTLFGVERLLLVVSASFALSTLPFLLFTSYVLRLATLAQKTLSMGPLELT